MVIYNVRLYDYIDERKQIRIYSRPVVSGTDVNEKITQKRLETLKRNKEGSSARTQKQIDASREKSMNRTKNKIYEIARSNRWEYFITFTFNPQKINSKNYDYVVQTVHDWIKRIKKAYAPDLYYILVPELHADGKKWHFHGLFGNTGNIRFVDSGHKSGEDIIYNIPDFPYGFSTATKVKDSNKVSAYITKYITKDLCAVTENRKRYWVSTNINRPAPVGYCMPQDEISRFMEDISEDVLYIKTLDVPFAEQKVKYIEM